MTKSQLLRKSLSWRIIDRIILSLICFLLLLTLFLSLSFVGGLITFVKDKEKNDLNSRRFLVAREVPLQGDVNVEIKRLVEENQEISSIVPQSAEKIFISASVDNHEFDMRFYGVSPGESPKIIRGRDINFQHKNEILVPDYLYFNNGGEVSGEYLLGKSIDTVYIPANQSKGNPKSVGKDTVSFKVVGVFDSQGYILEGQKRKSSLLYGAAGDIQQLNELRDIAFSKEQEGRPFFLVTIKPSGDINRVIKQLGNQGYELVTKILELNSTAIFIITTIFIAVTILIVAFSLFIIVLLQKSFLKRRMIEMGLMRIQGHSPGEIRRILLINIFSDMMLPFIGAILLAYMISTRISLIIFWNNRIGNLGLITGSSGLLLLLLSLFLIVRFALAKAYEKSPAFMIKEVD